MSAKSLACGAVFLAVILLTFGTTARAAEPGLVTKWLSTAMKIDECVRTAERALRAAQFARVDIKGDSDTDKNAFANRGNYVASVNCIEEKGVAYFVVAGPDVDAAERYVNAIMDKF